MMERAYSCATLDSAIIASHTQADHNLETIFKPNGITMGCRLFEDCGPQPMGTTSSRRKVRLARNRSCINRNSS